MKRLAIFQDDLEIGGIQKSLINLLNNLDSSEYSVDLFLFRENGAWEKDLPSAVRVTHLRPMKSIYKYLPFDTALSAAEFDFSFVEENYDLAVDFNSYQPWTAAGAILIPAEKRVMWVHNDVEIKFREEWKYRVLFRCMRGKYKYFEEFACVSEAIREPFIRMTKQSDKDFFTVPNYVDTDQIFASLNEEAEDIVIDAGCYNVCAVGRLCHQKGYDIMLDTFAEAYSQRKDLRLYIIGGGPERDALQNQIESAGLQDAAFLLGHRPNPYALMNRCDAFVSTSRYEGQGINIMEAKALGLKIFIPPHLEKYVEGVKGTENIAESLGSVAKTEKKFDDLAQYNAKTLAMIADLC